VHAFNDGWGELASGVEWDDVPAVFAEDSDREVKAERGPDGLQDEGEEIDGAEGALGGVGPCSG
jgi:hypothetical protein